MDGCRDGPVVSMGGFFDKVASANSTMRSAPPNTTKAAIEVR